MSNFEDYLIKERYTYLYMFFLLLYLSIERVSVLIYYFIIYLILLLIAAYYNQYLVDRKSNSEIIPLFIPSFITSIIITFLTFPYVITFPIMGFYLIYESVSDINQDKGKLSRLSKIVFSIFLIVGSISLFSFYNPSRDLNPTGEFIDDTDFMIEYYPYSSVELGSGIEQETKHGYVYKSLLLLGIRSDYNYSYPYIVNMDLYIDIDLLNRLPDANDDFWHVQIDYRLIELNEYSRTMLDAVELTGYDLYAYLRTFEDDSRVFYQSGTEENANLNNVTINRPGLSMGTFFLAIDFTILAKSESNEELYSSRDSEDVVLGGVKIVVQSEITVDVESPGYVWVYTSIMPSPLAGNFLEDLIGEVTLSVLVAVFILYLVVLAISLIVRNMKIITIVQVTLIFVMVLATFSKIADAFNEVPFWLKAIMPDDKAKYLWGVIEGVKGMLVFGVVGVIMLRITEFVNASYSLLFGEKLTMGAIGKRLDGKEKKVRNKFF